MVTTGYAGVGVGFTGDETVMVPVFMSVINVPPVNSATGCPFKDVKLTVPVLYTGNWVVAYCLSNWTPICSDIVTVGNVSNIISELLETNGLIGNPKKPLN